MFNQQVLILYAIALSPFPLVYISVKVFDWWQGNQRSLFYANWHKDNEKIRREGLMIQLEEVTKQRDEFQDMYFRLHAQKTNSNEPEPKGFKEFNDFLIKENKEIKGMFIELNRAYSESQRELRELKDVSIRFVKDLELDFVFDGIIVDNPSGIVVNHYNNLKSILK